MSLTAARNLGFPRMDSQSSLHRRFLPIELVVLRKQNVLRIILEEQTAHSSYKTGRRNDCPLNRQTGDEKTDER